MESHITPAINVQDELFTEISDEEFHRKLFAWFEERGLLSELRAHLRIQMISVLKETALGKKVSSTQLLQSVSPKIQVLNSLVAEFLLYQNCYYTLSIFSTEIPTHNVLPEYSKYLLSNKDSVTAKKQRFSENEVSDMLETLGMIKSSEEVPFIVNLYCNKNTDDSLLMCIMRMLSNLRISKPKTFERKENVTVPKKLFTIISEKVDEHDKSRKKNVYNLIRLLKEIHLDTALIQQILNHLEIILTAEQSYFFKQHKEEISKLQIALNERVNKKENDWKSKFEALKKSMEIENKLMSNKLTERECQLNETVKTKMDLKKTNLEQSEEILNLRQSIMQFEKCLFEKGQEIKDKERKLKLEHDQMQVLLYQLQQENAQLKALNDEQHEHIMELSNKISALQLDVKESRTKLSSLKCSPLRVASSSTLNSSASDVNDAEKDCHVTRTSVEHNNGDSKLTTSEKYAYLSSDLSNQSPTSLIVLETKRRLKLLESESKQIDRQFKSFQSRQKSCIQITNDANESGDCEQYKSGDNEMDNEYILSKLLSNIKLHDGSEHYLWELDGTTEDSVKCNKMNTNTNNELILTQNNSESDSFEYKTGSRYSHK